MSRFLSDAWFAEVATAETAAQGPATLTLQQVVTGTPSGEVRYRVLVGSGGARIEPGGGPSDLVFTSDYATASAVAAGRLSVQAALSAGRIRVGGDTARLAAHQPLLAALDPVPPVVREATTWDDEGDGDRRASRP